MAAIHDRQTYSFCSTSEHDPRRFSMRVCHKTLICHKTLRRPGESLPVSNLDPAAIAQGVRQIAHDLHQILRKTTLSPGELIELERRIDELRVHTCGTGLIAIDRWLANSRSAIRARAVAEQTSIEDNALPLFRGATPLFSP
jgi:hypothetical protein